MPLKFESVADQFGGGVKADVGKLRLDLLPFDTLNEVAGVLTYGAEKYEARNWEKGMGYMRLVGATLRHLFAFASGEDRDPETGYLHTAHAICCLMFLTSFRLRDMGGDDRPVYGPPAGGVPWGMEAPSAAAKPVELPAPAVTHYSAPGALPHRDWSLVIEPIKPPGDPTPMSWADRPKKPQKIVDIPEHVRFRYNPIPASKTAVNSDGPMDAWPTIGDYILIYMDGEFRWRLVRDSSNGMDGRKYNVAQVVGSTSIMMVPHSHIFAIRTRTRVYFGNGSRAETIELG